MFLFTFLSVFLYIFCTKESIENITSSRTIKTPSTLLDEESFFWGCPLPFKINHLSLHEIILPYTDWYFQLLFGLLVKLQNLVGRTITLLMLLLKPWSIANMCPVLIFFCQFYFGRCRCRWNGWTGSTSLFLRQIYSFFFFF